MKTNKKSVSALVMKSGRLALSSVLLLFLATPYLPLTAHAEEAPIFVDVPNAHQYSRSINALYKQGVVEGKMKEDGRYFSPAQEINRAEALKLLLVSAQVPIVRDISSPFNDVTVYDWFYPFVYTALKRDIVKGFPDGSFQPANKVILAEFLKMLVVAFDIPIPPQQDGEPWYGPYFRVAEGYKITLDDKNPTKNVTRGEAAAMIFKIQIIRYFSDWMNN